MEFHRCYGCMAEKQGPVCPYCGWEDGQQNAPHQLPVGTVLRGQYLVGRVLGQGGFGITYLGWDLKLDAPIAIKEYFPSEAVYRDSTVDTTVATMDRTREAYYEKNKQRFLKEAQVLSQFTDRKHIVHVYNFFPENTTAYIVMEYIKGRTLQQKIRQDGPLSFKETLSLLDPLMEDLHQVHKKGLIHRDISPDNIIVEETGSARLLDFGSVRQVLEADPNQPVSKSTEAILKQGYAPLEQYNSRGNLGPWTDVYALCATICFCLTGQVPKPSPDRIIEEDQMLASVPGLTNGQKQVLSWGLALRPDARISSVEELRRRLRDSLTLKGTSHLKDSRKPDAPKKKTPLPWILGACGAAAAAIAACLLLIPKVSPEAPTETASTQAYETVLPPIEEETSQPVLVATEPEDYLEFSPDLVLCNKQAPGARIPTTVFGSQLPRNQVYSITFLDSLEGAPADAVDVSETGNGRVLMWWTMEPYGADVMVAGDGGVFAPESSACLFGTDEYGTLSQKFTKLKKIDFGTAFHTDQVRSMYCMFGWCSMLEEIDVSGFDTGNVAEFARMFSNCMSLKALDLTSFAGVSATVPFQLFYHCSSLETLDITGLPTDGIGPVDRIFQYCGSLKNFSGPEEFRVLIPNPPPAKPAQADPTQPPLAAKDSEDYLAFSPDLVLQNHGGDADYIRSTMFGTELLRAYVSSVTFLDSLENAPADAVDVSETGNGRVLMWWDQEGTEAQVFIAGDGGVFAPENCNFLFGTFEGDRDSHKYVRLKKIDFGTAFHTENITSMQGMFQWCTALEEVDFSHFRVDRLEDTILMFAHCSSLASLDLGSFELGGNTGKTRMFSHCTNLETLDISGFSADSFNPIEDIFAFCGNLKTVIGPQEYQDLVTK